MQLRACSWLSPRLPWPTWATAPSRRWAQIWWLGQHLQKAGSASAMTEMVQDLGISFGIALLGSIAGAVYQRTITPLLSGELTAATREAVADSLWAASSVAAHLSPEQVAQAQAAFVSGVRGAALFSAVSVAALAVVSAVALRHLRSSGVGDGR